MSNKIRVQANVKEFENVTIEIPEDPEEEHLNNL